MLHSVRKCVTSGYFLLSVQAFNVSTYHFLTNQCLTIVYMHGNARLIVIAKWLLNCNNGNKSRSAVFNFYRISMMKFLKLTRFRSFLQFANTLTMIQLQFLKVCMEFKLKLEPDLCACIHQSLDPIICTSLVSLSLSSE